VVIHYQKIKKPLFLKAAKLLNLFGGGERDRTADLYVAKASRPQIQHIFQYIVSCVFWYIIVFGMIKN